MYKSVQKLSFLYSDLYSDMKKGEEMDRYFEVKGTDLRILLPEEVDHFNAERIRKEADRILQSRNIRRIVFDFSRTQFMDSSGIGVIMGRYKNMRFMGGTVIAVHVNERIRRILTLSGVYKVLDIYEGQPLQSNIF